MNKLSNAFIKALVNNPQPLWILGPAVGIHPSRISTLIHGKPVKRIHDVRYRLLAERIGYAGPIFEMGQQMT